jgi:hypothetical protein
VQERLAELDRKKHEEQQLVQTNEGVNDRNPVANNRARSKRRKGLTQEERVQLAADLGLISGREEELPFVLPEEPEQ